MPVINVYGKHGSGKSFYFKNKPVIEIDYEILKTKEDTLDFLERMKCSSKAVLVDNYESVTSCSGIGELYGNVYIISESKLELKNIEGYFQVPQVSATELTKALGGAREVTEDEANGNLHLLFSSTFDARDIFQDTFKYVEYLFSNVCELNLDKVNSEHGHLFGIIHENCISLDPRVSESFSDADMLDSYIYSDTSWNVLPFFYVSACMIPSSILRPLKFDTLRTGSMWTKFSNMCMKRNRLKKLGYPLDTISLLVQKANAGDPLSEIKDTYDLDTINQLALLTKIKVKTLNQLKKVRRQNQTPPLPK